jgi:hypothetical protein
MLEGRYVEGRIGNTAKLYTFENRTLSLSYFFRDKETDFLWEKNFM